MNAIAMPNAISAPPIACAAQVWTRVFEGPVLPGFIFVAANAPLARVRFEVHSAAAPFQRHGVLSLDEGARPVYIGLTPYAELRVWCPVDCRITIV